MLIYIATNNINNKSYIGQARCFKRRKYEHLWSVYKPKQKDYNSYFHRAIRKYGENNFTWRIIKDNIKNIKCLNKFEKYFIKKLKTMHPNGYNVTEGGNGVFGYKHNKERRLKIKNSHIGHKHSKETKERMSKSATGKIFSKQHCKNISKSKTGKKIKSFTKEHKDKLSIALRGKNNPMYGKHHTKKMKEKISKGVLKYVSKIKSK